MSAWNQSFLLPNQLSTYANAVHLKGAPLSNSFDFIDGAVIPIEDLIQIRKHHIMILKKLRLSNFKVWHYRMGLLEVLVGHMKGDTLAALPNFTSNIKQI